MEINKKMFEDNYDRIARLFGYNYLKKTISDSLKVEEVLEANNYLAEFLYGKEVFKLLEENNINGLTSLYQSNVESFSFNRGLLNNIDLSSLGIVLIRPEIIELVPQYRIFLKKLGLDIVLDKDITIDFIQYWTIYHHGLIDVESRYDFPTRTFNYINNVCRLFIVSNGNLKISYSTLSAFLNSIKGKQGSYKQNTLRGDLAFNYLSNVISNDPNTFKKEYNVLLDPIGAYRKLVRSEIVSDRLHEQAQIPLLFYSGQSVHVPNEEELLRDVSALCNIEDIQEIRENQKVLKK